MCLLPLCASGECRTCDAFENSQTSTDSQLCRGLLRYTKPRGVFFFALNSHVCIRHPLGHDRDGSRLVALETKSCSRRLPSSVHYSKITSLFRRRAFVNCHISPISLKLKYTRSSMMTINSFLCAGRILSGLPKPQQVHNRSALGLSADLRRVSQTQIRLPKRQHGAIHRWRQKWVSLLPPATNDTYAHSNASPLFIKPSGGDFSL